MSESPPNLPAPAGGDFVLYQTEDGRTRIEVRFSGETVWLSLNQLADLFQRDKPVISKHIKNVFAARELVLEATVAKFATVQPEGGREVSREIEFYNLDVIISVGYRVKSRRGTQFRIWAAHGRTAAEIISRRADAGKPNMGLTSWAGSRPRKEEAAIAKNYLAAGELAGLNRIVTAYLEFAELQAQNRKAMYMRDWIAKLDDFLRLSEHHILTRAGKITHEAALAKAEAEYEKFRAREAAKTSPVEIHFQEAIEQVKQLAHRKPRKLPPESPQQ